MTRLYTEAERAATERLMRAAESVVENGCLCEGEQGCVNCGDLEALDQALCVMKRDPVAVPVAQPDLSRLAEAADNTIECPDCNGEGCTECGDIGYRKERDSDPHHYDGPDELVFVFDGPPGPEGGRLIEVEDMHGNSVRAGEWEQRGERWTLSVPLRNPLAPIIAGTGLDPRSDDPRSDDEVFAAAVEQAGGGDVVARAAANLRAHRAGTGLGGELPATCGACEHMERGDDGSCQHPLFVDDRREPGPLRTEPPPPTCPLRTPRKEREPESVRRPIGALPWDPLDPFGVSTPRKEQKR